MKTPERQLRVAQIGCILVLLASIRLAIKVQGKTQGSKVVQWVLIVLALVCAVQGFAVQQRIVNPKRMPKRGARSTPFSRWRAGNVVRLMFATAVGLYGLCLSEFGGAVWQTSSIFALAMVLLLIWSPGASPASTDSEKLSR